MSATRGLIAGTLLLTAGEAVLASGDRQAGGGAVGALFTVTASVLNRLMNPAVPLIPDLRTQGKASAPAVYRTPALPAVAAPSGGGLKSA